MLPPGSNPAGAAQYTDGSEGVNGQKKGIGDDQKSGHFGPFLTVLPGLMPDRASMSARHRVGAKHGDCPRGLLVRDPSIAKRQNDDFLVLEHLARGLDRAPRAGLRTADR